MGTVLGIRFVVALATIGGRSAARWFAMALAVYYTALSARTRRASRQFLARVGEAPSLRNVLRHVATFASVAVDRLFFLRGDLRPFTFELRGHERVKELAARGRGALLLGSHLGSFAAMSAAARDFGVPLSVVADERSAARLARVLRRVAAGGGPEVIPVDPKGFDTVFRVKSALAAGHLVAILGDRTTGRDGRNVQVDFLGAPAHLPVGPYVVAHTLGCPVVLVFALFRGPNRYEISCEPFADELRLDRRDRAGALRAHAQRYADRLAFHARSAPYNWFNFHDFWSAS